MNPLQNNQTYSTSNRQSSIFRRLTNSVYSCLKFFSKFTIFAIQLIWHSLIKVLYFIYKVIRSPFTLIRSLIFKSSNQINIPNETVNVDEKFLNKMRLYAEVLDKIIETTPIDTTIIDMPDIEMPDSIEKAKIKKLNTDKAISYLNSSYCTRELKDLIEEMFLEVRQLQYLITSWLHYAKEEGISAETFFNDFPSLKDSITSARGVEILNLLIQRFSSNEVRQILTILAYEIPSGRSDAAKEKESMLESLSKIEILENKATSIMEKCFDKITKEECFYILQRGLLNYNKKNRILGNGNIMLIGFKSEYFLAPEHE